MKSRLKVIFCLLLATMASIMLTVSAPALADTESDQVFLQAMSEQLDEDTQMLYGGLPDSAKIEAGQFACQSFKRGISLQELNLLGLQRHNPSQSALRYVEALAQAAIAAYCPGYSP